MGGRVARWQLGGFLFVCAAGTALHFLYQWSGESVAAAPFAAVNESVWEHMKLLFWPMLLWAGAERAVLGGYSRGFWPAKALGTLLGLALIPALYYTYTGALDVSVMWVDIAIFFCGRCRGFSRGDEDAGPGLALPGRGPGVRPGPSPAAVRGLCSLHLRPAPLPPVPGPGHRLLRTGAVRPFHS